MSRYEEAINRIDAANAEDPREELVEGGTVPKELIYGRRMSAWLEKLRPDAPEALRLAARAQHIRRWEVPRESYPMDRTGYLMWRKGLYRFHADTAAAILRDVGYDQETIERMSFLLQKKQLTRDPDTQSLEDAACLVFLQYHITEFAARTDPDKMMGIIKKT
ncbi:MAG: DUF4202 domain-containing protein, partial [Candidatus Hydrogenedentes bacterium]|nr:DUF4202 domain-containing protein [Candidatus Hydrogenedentota bacterium]